MNDPILVVPVEVKKIETLGDFTLRLRIDTTKEFTNDETAKLIGFIKQGPLYMAVFAKRPTETELGKIDRPADFVDVDTKTKSQKMRSILYRIWEHSDREVDSEVYYQRRMDKMNDILLEELRELEE